MILSISDDAQTRGRAQAAGTVAFVEKHGATETLLSAIRQAADWQERAASNRWQSIAEHVVVFL